MSHEQIEKSYLLKQEFVYFYYASYSCYECNGFVTMQGKDHPISLKSKILEAVAIQFELTGTFAELDNKIMIRNISRLN